MSLTAVCASDITFCLSFYFYVWISTIFIGIISEEIDIFVTPCLINARSTDNQFFIMNFKIINKKLEMIFKKNPSLKLNIV